MTKFITGRKNATARRQHRVAQPFFSSDSDPDWPLSHLLGSDYGIPSPSWAVVFFLRGF